jgi:ABC-type multidrug transport system fused ATPase/permease subunit
MRQLYDCNIAQVKCWAGLGTLSEFMTLAFSAAILCLGGLAVANDQLSVGELVSFYLYVGLMLMPLHMVIYQATERLTTGEVALERIFRLLDTPPGRELEGRKTPCPKLSGRIDFESVHFAYTEGNEVLSEISFSVEPGSTVALVGPSGSGKSTTVNLLCRFYLPTAGTIKVDGQNIDQFEVDSLRNQIGFVSQDSFLFSGSVRDNLLFVKPKATEEELVAAARQANAHAFITALPHGYDTLVGERGVMLSGGQKQRINLTRALLRDPAILVLDEPTAALDADSESIIMEAINKTFRGKTRIIIAHRLATVASADKIIVLSSGRMIQEGTHVELSRQDGLYRELCSKQFLLGDSPRPSGAGPFGPLLHMG